MTRILCFAAASCFITVGLTRHANAQIGGEYIDPTANSGNPTNISRVHGCDGPHAVDSVHLGNDFFLV
jgi:hypothetical protein